MPSCAQQEPGAAFQGENWEVNLVLTHDPELSNPPGLELEGFMEPLLPSCCKATGSRLVSWVNTLLSQ